MFYSITLPAKYHCLACNNLFHEPEIAYERKGRYYRRREKCPSCKSEKIETATDFRMSGRYEQAKTGEGGRDG